MSAAKHTPGPWWVCGDRPGERRNMNATVRATLDGSTRTTVCRLGQNNNRPREWADADLIAAAPDLLAALERLLLSGDVRDAAEKGALAQARAAIAKATGGEA